MVEELKKDDKIITGGGMYAVVKSVDTDTITVEIADGVRVKITRGSVAHVITEGKDKPKE